MLKISRPLYEEIVAHALADAPNECCGLVASVGDEAVRILPTANVYDHPKYGYQADPDDLATHLDRISNEGWVVGATYHSHPRSQAIPSQTDININSDNPWWPDAIYIIVGLEQPDQPDVRAWRIESNTPEEVALSVV